MTWNCQPRLQGPCSADSQDNKHINLAQVQVSTKPFSAPIDDLFNPIPLCSVHVSPTSKGVSPLMSQVITYWGPWGPTCPCRLSGLRSPRCPTTARLSPRLPASALPCQASRAT